MASVILIDHCKILTLQAGMTRLRHSLKMRDSMAENFAVQELSDFAPGREWRLIEINARLSDIDRHRNHLVGTIA